MSLFMRRYREMSRRSTTAFWLCLSSACLGLLITAVGFNGGYRSGTLDAIHGVCTFVMFVSLGVLCVGLMLENRRRTQ